MQTTGKSIDPIGPIIYSHYYANYATINTIILLNKYQICNITSCFLQFCSFYVSNPIKNDAELKVPFPLPYLIQIQLELF